MTPTTIENLPTIGRSFSDLAALSPGVYVSGSNVAIGGNQSYQTGFIVDSTNIEDNRNGGQIIRFAQDWITEFSVVSQAPNAEFGSASGGVVGSTVKSTVSVQMAW